MQRNQRVRAFFRKILAAGLVAGLIGGWILTHQAAEKLLTVRRKPLEEHHLKTLTNPADFGLQIQQLLVTAPDGISIDALWVSPSPNPGQAIKMRRMQQRLGLKTAPARGTIVLLHGRGGCKEDCLPITERFCAAGFACLILDSRAHGQSGGRYCTYGRLEAGDVSAALDAALARHGPGAAPFGIWGISLGGAIALQTAAADDRIEAVISIGTFANLGEVSAEVANRRLSAHAGSAITPLVLLEASRTAGTNLFRANPTSAAARLRIPAMIVHGEKDGLIAAEHGQQIFRSIADPRKQHRQISEATHGSVLLKGGDDLYQEMIEFYLAALPKS